MQSKYILSFFLLFISTAIFASVDKAHLSGVVRDQTTHLPLVGATVSIPDLKRSTTTDRSGHYWFPSLPFGRFTVQVSYIGYSSKVESIVVSGAATQDFLLQSSVVENENVTVTGVSSATRLKRTPVHVSIIAHRDLQRSMGTQLLDVVAKEPGVSIVTTGPAIAKPFIRGLGYNRVVTINDGVRQEGQQWGDEHGLEIDQYSAQKIEVLRGPASLMYGSDAIGGVINILTNVPVANNTVQANLQTTVNANNRMWGHYLNVAGNIDGLNWNAYGSLKKAGDYQNRYDGQVLNSRFGEKNFGGYIGINKSWGFSHLLFSHFDQDIGMVEGERDAQGQLVLEGYSITESMKKDKTPLVPWQGVQHTKIALDNAFSFQNNGRLNVLVGFQQNQRKEFAQVDVPNEPEAFFDLKTINYNLAYQVPELQNWTTSLGINGMKQWNENKAEEAIIPDYNLFDFGLYGVTAKTWNQTTLSGGLRYDIRNLDSKPMGAGAEPRFSAFTKNFSNFSASIGATHAISGQVSLKASVSRGFRAPNSSELSANGEHEGTNRYEIGNIGLKSEVSTSIDAGIDITTNHVDISVAPYFNYINHYIFYNRLSAANGADSVIDGASVFQFNQQSARLIGVEARIDVHPHPLDWLHFENTISLVRGRFTNPVDGSYNLPLIAPASLLTELRGEFTNGAAIWSNFYAKIEMNAVATQHHYFAGYETETETRGYVLLNAGIGGDLKIAGQKRCALHLGVQNLADKGYQNHLSRLKYSAANPVTGRVGVFNMGRSFTARLIIPFEWKL